MTELARSPSGTAPAEWAGGPSTPDERADGAPDAARAYKDVVAGLTAPADELRARDRERLAALEVRLAELATAMAEARERAEKSAEAAKKRWEAALESLWAESWLKLRPLPRPDPWADPAKLDALDARVELCAAALREALHRKMRLRRM